jgi:hypothetical protein
MLEAGVKQRPRNGVMRNLAIGFIVVMAIAIVLLVSYSLTVDPLRTLLGYAAIIFLPIILILGYALVIVVLHRRRPISSARE